MSGRVDVAELRRRLAEAPPGELWRGLEELAADPEFRALVESEFPGGLGAASVTRRRFLQLMGASLAMAGLASCTKEPPESIVPYVTAPEEIVPGRPLYYATALELGGAAAGVLVETHEGRPTKVEGNPDHPESLGATDAFAQAAVLGLYDPDRSRAPVHSGRVATWTSFVEALETALEAEAGREGAGLSVLTPPTPSPTLGRQMEALRARYPQARWTRYEPLEASGRREGLRMAFGRPLEPRPRLEAADVILSLDDDFLGCTGGSLRATREFSRRRRILDGEAGRVNRLYVVESAPTVTGSMADHRFPVRATEVEAIARRLARRLGVGGVEAGGEAEPWLEALAADLERAGAAALVLAGEGQPAPVHALAAALNDSLGATGRTVEYHRPAAAVDAEGLESLEDLAARIAEGRVRTLLVLGGNPVHDGPAGLDLGRRIASVPFSVHLGLHEDETSAVTAWHLPATHPFEAWSDLVGPGGVATILQPMIEPLYAGRSVHEVLALVAGEGSRPGRDLVRETWRDLDDESWRRALHDGVVPGRASRAESVELRLELPDPPERADGFEVVFRPDPAVWDGRFANNAWLQEMPRPITKLVWDNAVWIAPRTAESAGLSNGDVVDLSRDGATIRGPVWIVPGMPAGSASVSLGYGRRSAGSVGTGVGFDAYPLWRDRERRFVTGVDLAPTGLRHELVTTQVHHSMHGRDHVRVHSIGSEPERHPPPRVESLYPGWSYDGPAWGMAIDLNLCVGCQACVVACQAENNVPVVGKEEVARSREMHWLRVDTYHDGDLDDPRTYHMPVPCMHCETAPCEPVCPVAATTHSDEGLNEMTYNRCIGTRYCSNNCPYKVRRFNFLQYVDEETPSLALLRNPDVTVRSRGVMEKCTYCVQRISAARIEAKREDRPIRDGEVRTACQAVCPAEAIVFGDLADRDSRVRALRDQSRTYALLAELGTKPRTTYLARFRNPNPALEDA